MDITLDELIKMLLIKIGRNDLIGKEQMEFTFLYNATRLNTTENKSKKIFELFWNSPNPEIFYFKINSSRKK